MRKYIYSIFLLGLFSCQEEGVVQYTQEKDGLQFSANSSEDMTKVFNFATATYEEEINGEPKTFYYGDSLAAYTFERVVLDLQGFPTPDEREYKLKTVLVEDQDSSKVAEVVFEPYYSLAPNQLKDTIKITVLRPKTRGTYTVGITVDTEGKGAFFDKGVVEKSILRLDIQDVYEQPKGWEERLEWLGEFDEEKYAFMVTVSKQAFSKENNHMWNETDKYNLELRQALARFNASAAPEDQKKFSFPVTTKLVWWDKQLKFLGEFSEEKHEFIKNLLSEEGETLANNSKLEYWNLVFRDAVAEQGITEFSFPVVTVQSSWWRESLLGAFSPEKQEFIVRELFPRSDYQIKDGTWDYANPVLRVLLEQYNAEHPEAPLAFDFPIEGRPEWWDFRESYLGEYSDIKRDIAVVAVLTEQMYYGECNINPLVNQNMSMDNVMGAIRDAINAYNEEHPDSQLELPASAPGWWAEKSNYLGDYSPEKEAFMQQIMPVYNATYQEWANWTDWNPIFRYELAAYNSAYPDAPYGFTFPEVDTKPSYWDELPYLGEYSEAKRVFIWITLMPKNYGNVDGWFLGAPSEWGNPNDWPARHTTLTEAYANRYEDFMKKYAGANPTPFDFPASW